MLQSSHSVFGSMFEVFAIPGLTPSIIMWVAVILYSPLLALSSLLGATIGSSLPLLLLGRRRSQRNIFITFSSKTFH